MEKNFSPRELDRIIEMAWEDRTTFEAINYQFDISEHQVTEIMRSALKPSSFRLWRKRVQGRNTKHEALRANKTGRFRSSRQRTISGNKISKR